MSVSIDEKGTLMNGSRMGRAAWVLLAIASWAQPGIAAAMSSHVDRPVSTTPSDSTVTFPTTAVGQTSTLCEGLCYTVNGTGALACP
jgi:hypothetical protein